MLLGSRGRIISEILICTHSLNMVTPGADSVVLGAEEIQKREREEIILPGKEESGVGWVLWAAGPRQARLLVEPCKVTGPQRVGRAIHLSRKLVLGISLLCSRGNTGPCVSWK